jgi:hypothetical protein
MFSNAKIDLVTKTVGRNETIEAPIRKAYCFDVMALPIMTTSVFLPVASSAQTAGMLRSNLNAGIEKILGRQMSNRNQIISCQTKLS